MAFLGHKRTEILNQLSRNREYKHSILNNMIRLQRDAVMCSPSLAGTGLTRSLLVFLFSSPSIIVCDEPVRLR